MKLQINRVNKAKIKLLKMEIIENVNLQQWLRKGHERRKAIKRKEE